jgi:hypothetical protein
MHNNRCHHDLMIARRRSVAGQRRGQQRRDTHADTDRGDRDRLRGNATGGHHGRDHRRGQVCTTRTGHGSHIDKPTHTQDADRLDEYIELIVVNG